MGFIHMTLIDLIDIVLVAVILFQIYRLTRGTNALQIMIGIALVYLLSLIVRLLNMEMLSMILGQIIGVGVIALIVVFQPEVRRFLLLLGTQYGRRRHTLFGRFFKSRNKEEQLEWIEPIVEACGEMAETETGALIVIQRSVSLMPYTERGVKLDSRLSTDLIKNVFFKNAPMHDGAMLIANQRIMAARCMLPTTERMVVPPEFGTRHRAALGISEITDALAIVVSEERGSIAVARKGYIRQNLTTQQLRAHLRKIMSMS